MNINPANNVSFKGRLPIDKVMEKTIEKIS